MSGRATDATDLPSNERKDWMIIEWNWCGVKILNVVKEVSLRVCYEEHGEGQSRVGVTRYCNAEFV